MPNEIMDTDLIPILLDSRASRQSISQAIPSQLIVEQIADPHYSWSSSVAFQPVYPYFPQFDGQLSLELTKYACSLIHSSTVSSTRFCPTEAELQCTDWWTEAISDGMSHNTLHSVVPVSNPVARRYAGGSSIFASPIVPMQQRDRTILKNLFEREDMHDIHADITDQLGKLVPEPCWDDDPYKFLGDYLT